MLPLNIKVFAGTTIVVGLIVVGQSMRVSLPGNHEGYAPEQPIAFSHRMHAGELGIDCLYCHYGARKSRTAGIPPASLCMNCHKSVAAGYDVTETERRAAKEAGREPKRIVSAEIRKIYDALGLDVDGNRVADKPRKGLEWIRVHNLPDFVAFDHSVHVARGVACQSCHGPVQTFERMRQHSDLSMGWCIDCHRKTPVQDALGAARLPTTDCAACHY